MERLAYQDVRAFSNSLREIYACLDIDALPAQLLKILQKIVPSEVLTYVEINFQKSSGTYTVLPSEIDTRENARLFESHMQEHPLLKYHMQTHLPDPVKISDVVSRSRFHRTGLYNELFLRLGVEHQIGFMIDQGLPLISAIGIKRSRMDFSERDRLLLSLLQPHFVQVYRNAKRFREMKDGSRSLTPTGVKLNSGVVSIENSGQADQLEDHIKVLFDQYFGTNSCKGNGLPEKLKQWIRHQQSTLFQDGNTPPPQAPLFIAQNGRRLTLKLVRGGLGNRNSVFFEEHQVDALPSSLESLGITRRQAEVLFWITRGKTNREVGLILNMRPRTVEKHLERIFTKLGVENRTAAAARVLEAFGTSRL